METPEIRLKRLKIRSMRRGIREMDILLSRFADVGLVALEPWEIDLYEQLLEENDHDILGWVTGVTLTPPHFMTLLTAIKSSVP